MFDPDPQDRRLASTRVGRSRCQLCGCYFSISEHAAGQSGICGDCIVLEIAPLQDNDPHEGGFCRPREAPEITVARMARLKAEAEADRLYLALLQHHQILCAIAGSRGKGPLRLFPREQSRLASHGLDLMEENFPDIAERLGLIGGAESG